MMTKLVFSTFGLMLLLAPTVVFALNETADTPVAQTAPAQAITVQTAPENTPSLPPAATHAPLTPAKSAPSSPAPTQPAIAPTSAPQPTAKPAPATVLATPPKATVPTPATRLPAQQPTVQPLHATPAPVKSAATKPAPVSNAPAKSSPPQTTPLQSPVTQESISGADAETIDIEVFDREGCPQCDKAKEFLAKLQTLQPHLKIIIRDVRKEPAALVLLKRMALNQGGETLDYPAFVVGGQLIIGFSEENSTAQLILDTLATSHPARQRDKIDTDNCSTGKEPSCGLIPPTPVAKPEIIVLDLWGHKVPLLQIGLPLFTLTMGILDGLNHGSTWVLILMISLLAPMKNRPYMLAIAGTFITMQGIIYFLLLAAWLNLFMQIEISLIVQIAIACTSLIASALYFKKYLYFGQSISLSSHEISKPGIYTRIRKIVESENLFAAILTTIGLAILVQISELSYKSIFPLLYTQVLTLQHLDRLSNYAYLLLYDFAYMLDDIVILMIGVITLKQDRMQQTEGRILKFVSGLILAGLAAHFLLTQIEFNSTLL